MKKAGITDYRAFAMDILSIIKDKPISFEAFSDDFSQMERQAKDIASWAKMFMSRYLSLTLRASLVII